MRQQALPVPGCGTGNLSPVGTLPITYREVFFCQHSEKQRAPCQRCKIADGPLTGSVVQVGEHVVADDQIGAVSGALHMNSEKGPGVYWKYEKMIRDAESRVDSVVGATGALYAIRRALFRELPPGTLLDDVYTPMQIAMQGYRVTFDNEARVYDEEASVKGEFSRKARTLAGNFQLMKLLPELLNPIRNRLFPQLFSHKVLRLFCPYALVALYGANVYLVATLAPGWPLYAVTLAGQTLVYGLALKKIITGGDEDSGGKLERISHSFVTLNAAAVEGLRRFLSQDMSWTSGR